MRDKKRRLIHVLLTIGLAVPCLFGFIARCISLYKIVVEKTSILGCVDTKIMCRFLSRISAQTRRENAGGLSPSKFSRRSMRKILPKRCVLGLVSTHPNVKAV